MTELVPPLMVLTLMCPKCNRSSHWPATKFRELTESLKNSSLGDWLGVSLCDEYNQISVHNCTIIRPLRNYDRASPPKGALHENLLVAQLRCVEKGCVTPIQVLAPRMAHYDKFSDVTSGASLWKVLADIKCPSGHPAGEVQSSIVAVLLTKDAPRE